MKMDFEGRSDIRARGGYIGLTPAKIAQALTKIGQ